jgi:2-oxoglutarate dehydrogenase E2 component (dihydrolipoamide succinyltransferase)
MGDIKPVEPKKIDLSPFYLRTGRLHIKRNEIVLVDVKVPILAESIPDATLLDWKKSPGDAVARDEILLELETDKVVLEVPAPQTGVLSEVLKKAGDVALSQEVLARIDTEASAPAGPADTAVVSAKAPEAAPAPVTHIALSPAVQHLVAEHDLDPSAITGTGKDGRLIKGDVLAFLDANKAQKPPRAPAAPAPVVSKPAATPAPVRGDGGKRREPLSRLRMRIAERLVQAQQTAAILTTFNEVNMQPVMELRKRYKEQFEKTHGVRLGFMSFFAKAAVQALERFPAVNAYIEGNEIVYHDYQDIGVAVGSPRGLVVPILRDVAKMSFADVESAIAEFGTRAHDGTLTIDDMSGGTFTISNGGVFGSLLSTPILNPPQSAILGMHKTQDRPMVVDGEIVVRPMMYLALSYDHRIVDGREAVLFLVAVKDAIEDPARLLLGV